VPHIHGHKRLDDDATENVKLHLRLTPEGETAFAVSREYVTVQELKGLNALLSAIFRVEYFNPTNLLNHVAPSIELMMSNLILLITASCNNLEHLHLTR